MNCIDFSSLFSQCSIGYAGDGTVCNRDTDLDGAPDVGLPCSDRRCRQVSMVVMKKHGQKYVQPFTHLCQDLITFKSEY